MTFLFAGVFNTGLYFALKEEERWISRNFYEVRTFLSYLFHLSSKLFVFIQNIVFLNNRLQSKSVITVLELLLTLPRYVSIETYSIYTDALRIAVLPTKDFSNECTKSFIANIVWVRIFICRKRDVITTFLSIDL